MKDKFEQVKNMHEHFSNEIPVTSLGFLNPKTQIKGNEQHNTHMQISFI